jgi:NADPH:quinone reductase-like Zn-dependent oxidoreductase
MRRRGRRALQAVTVRDGGALSYGQHPDPRPGPGEVLVELRAAAVNRRDLLVRSPPDANYEFPKPFVPGLDGSGVRRDTGEEVVIYPVVGWGASEVAAAPEMRFLGGARDGTYAELIAVPVENALPKPPRLSHAEAATLLVAGLTAFRALFRIGELARGETVLVLGAGSGVSTFAVALAAEAGARVFVTSSSPEKIERAKALGAQGGVLYTDPEWPQAFRELAGDADLVLDQVGTTWMDSLRCLGRGGRLVAFGGTGGGEATIDVRFLYLNWRSIRGTTLGSPREAAEFLRVVEQASWSPVIDSVRPLADAEAAQARMRANEHFGKLVLEVG